MQNINTPQQKEKKSLQQKNTTQRKIEKENSKDLTSKEFPYNYVKKLRKECSRYRVALKNMRQIYKDLPPESTKEYENLKKAFAQQKKYEEEKKQKTKEQKTERLITKIAASFDAIAPSQVAALLNKIIDIDDGGRAFVVGENSIAPSTKKRTAQPDTTHKKANMDKPGGEKSVEKFVSDFLQNNLHLVRSKSKRKGANTNPYIKNMFSIEQISTMTAKQYEKNRDRILKSLT
jgi:hypothetical protein